MKKWTAAILGAVLTASITACGNNEGGNNAPAASTAPAATAPAGSAAPAASPAAEASAAPAAQTSGVPTVEELITKATEAGQDLKSFQMDMTTAQNIKVTQGEQSQEMKTNMKTKSDFTKEPMMMHQTVTMTDPTGQGGADIEMEQYMTKDGVYSKTNGQWMKLPSSMTAELTKTLEQSVNPSAQLEQFKTITDSSKVTEEGDSYVLTADVSGDQVKELAKSYMNQSSSSNEQMAAMMDQMNIKSMKIVYGVNKETYLPTLTNVVMVMDMSAEGQSINLDMNIESTISKHNEVAEIKVPDEALKAQEAQMPAAGTGTTTAPAAQ